MAFSDDLVLKDWAAAQKTFARTTMGTDRSAWIDTSTTAAEPRTVSIAHRREPIKDLPGEYRDRHTVVFNVTKKDPTTGKPYNASVTLTVVMPLTGPIVRADVDHLRGFLMQGTTAESYGFVASNALIDKLLRNEL